MQLKRFTTFSLVLAGAAGAISCRAGDELAGPSTEPPPRDGSPVQTDSVRYHLRKVPGEYAATATAMYLNRTGAPVYYARCGRAATGPLFYLRRSGPDSTAASFIGEGWACVGGVPTGMLPPGESLTVRVWLGSTESPNANPPIRPSERVGRFRVELALCAAAAEDSDFCVPVPQPERQSNAFDVVFESP